MEITTLYAGLLAPLFILLSARAIGTRWNAKFAVGDGGKAALLRRMRVQANFAESRHPEVLGFRVFGMAATLTVLGTAATICFLGALLKIAAP